MLLKNLKSLSILLGMKCNCKCPHCFYFPRNDNFTPLDPAILDEGLKSIAGQHNIFSVNFAGGEPFYYFDIMLQCIEVLKKRGIHFFSLSTNAGWATNADEAFRKINILLKLGLSTIWVSADSFHQKNVPIENVLNIIKTSERFIGINPNFTVSVVSTYLGYFTYDCKFNRKTSEIRQIIWDKNLYPIETFVNAHGRGAYLIPKELHVNKRLDRKCWEFKMGMLNPAGPSMVSIDPTGCVDGCFGVPLGNLYKESLINIFYRYFRRPGPIVAVLREKGALGLKDLAMEKGFVPEKKYFDECHLCHMARNYLKANCADEFDEYLNPSACYPPALDNKVHPFEDWDLTRI
jgi:hypothetical protein